jgi:hypothetical protein
LALFGDNFLEILELADRAAILPHAPGQFSFGAHNQAYLDRGEGMSMLAWYSNDAHADAQRFQASGCGEYAPVDFSRNALLPSGEVVQFGFSLAFAAHVAMPRLAFFACQQHHPPKLFWRPQYQRHPNGAQRIIEVVLSANEPERHCDFLERASGGQAQPISGGLSIETTRGRLTILDQAEAARRFGGAAENDEPRFRALRFAVEDRSAAERIMRKHGVSGISRGGIALVPADAAHGVALEWSGGGTL